MFSQQHLAQQVECIDSYRFHCFYSVFLFLFLNHNSKSCTCSRVMLPSCYIRWCVFYYGLAYCKVSTTKLKPFSYWLKCSSCLVYHIEKCSCYFYLLFLPSPLHSHDSSASGNVDCIFES